MAKILVLDLETSPNIAHVWGLWNQNVGLSQLRESTQVMCYASKWLGSDKVDFAAAYRPVDGTWVRTAEARIKMLDKAHAALDEADIVVHFNGKKFDMPHLNREFVEHGYPPPSPYQQVDLLHVVRRTFRFPSNKLDYVSKTLQLTGKMGHSGHQLWVECLAGVPKAWATMRKYNKQDVVVTEELYHRLLPWITGHPAVNLYSDTPEEGCVNCGSTSLQSRGKAYTAISSYQRYRCNDCGKWQRGTSRLGYVGVR